jgi:signal transduction histidine kinase
MHFCDFRLYLDSLVMLYPIGDGQAMRRNTMMDLSVKHSDVMPVDEWYYRQEVLQTLFRWSLGITLVMGVIYMAAYLKSPSSTTLIIGEPFLLFPFIAWWCLHLLRQGQTQRAMQVFIASATMLAALVILFMPDNLILLGMMGLFLLVRIGAFLETSNSLVLLGTLWAILYLLLVPLRKWLALAQADLGALDSFFLYIVPVAILIVFILLDRTVTHYLKEALSQSEAARHELTRSYTKLEQQKKALEKSEANLSALAAKLERSNQKLQSANEELNSFAYVVSHDIKAPLRAIRNYADFLHEDLVDSLDGDQKKYINGLIHAVHEAEGLVEDLLALSRISRINFQIDKVNLGIFLQELVTSLDLPADVDIKWGQDWPTIYTEVVLLRQIFQNLILNAFKFNQSSPKIIEVGWLAAGDDNYDLFVRDNGIGIAERHQEQIFRVFQRLHTSQEYEGTGIGLAIVEKAAKKLGGSVRLESSSGQGSTFFITLPKTQVES